MDNTTDTDNREQQIKNTLEQLRPSLQADGGDLELVSISFPAVSVRLTGACGHCPHAMMTLKQGIERILKEKVSDEIEVKPVD